MSYLSEIIEVNYRSPIEVIETRGNSALISANLIRLDVPTGNGRIYRFVEAERIAKEAVGKPVRLFATWLGKHIHKKSHEVGRILKTWIDQTRRSIRGIVEIKNTKHFPHIVQEVKKNWGVSVGGHVDGFQLINKAGRLFAKCINFAITHLQLLKPDTPRGDEGAIVEAVTDVGESISFSRDPWTMLQVEGDFELEIKGSGISGVVID